MSSYPFDSLESLDAEIQRVESLLRKPGFKYPHMASARLQGLKDHRIKFTHPRIYRFRNWLADRLHYWAELLRC